MATVLHATGESHFLFLRLLNCSVHTLKDRLAQIFSGIFYCKPPGTHLIDTRTSREDELFPFAFQDVIATRSKYARNWLPNQNHSEDRGDADMVFNVLDVMLKASLERLKVMRGSISWAHVGLDGCTSEADYSQHVDKIRILSLEGRLGAAVWLRNKMIREGVVPDVVTHNYLVNGLCKFGLLDKAEWLVKEMERWGPAPSCATYNSLMKGYFAFDMVEKVFDLLSTMDNHKIMPNRVTCNILIQAFCKNGLFEVAKRLLAKLREENSERETSNLIASTIIMDSCFRKGYILEALTLWDEIFQSKEVDIVAYNVIIHGYCSNRDANHAYKYINVMLKSGLLPDIFTYNTLISALCKMGRISEACYLFTVMSRMGVAPDRISYKVLIRGLCITGDVDTAHELLNCMLENSMVPEPLVWNIIIDSYGKRGDKQALAVSNQMMSYGVSPNVYTYNALIHMLIKDGEIAKAYSVMKQMHLDGVLPDVVTYNMLIGAESNMGRLSSAEDLYNELRRRGYNPDTVTYTELIKGYCKTAKLKEAERLLGLLQSSNLVIDHVPFLVLIKRFCKMGEFDRAYGIYERWLERDKGEFSSKTRE